MRHTLRLACGFVAALAVPLCAGDTKAAGKGTLYERLGGEQALVLVIDDFVAAASADAKVNFTRNGMWSPTEANVARLKSGLLQFMSQAFGGPHKYTGEDMKRTHQGMAITQAEFDALAGHLDAALAKHKVPSAERKEVMAVAGSTAPDIIEKK